MRNKIIIISLIVFSFFSFNSNKLKELKPISEYIPDLSIEAQKEIARFYELLEKEKISISERKELEKLYETYDETTESVWDVVDGGCSWYCGGGNYKIEASSQLKANKSISYNAKKANDLSYKTAWVEGKEGSGIGEYLNYFFESESPQVTKVIVSNGYIKTAKTWKNNNRIKKLKLYVNNEPYAILKLNDNRSSQEFDFKFDWKSITVENIILRFEILEIYKGDLYDDTAITEIHFNGIGVH